MSSFSLPTLSRSDIVAILSESRIAAISETELANPSPKFVFDVYTSLLINLDLLQDGDGQADFVALERFENPDLHVDSVRIMNLFSKVKQILVAVCCPLKFTLNDLVQPHANRTMKFLSAIINFILYKNRKMEDLRPLVDELSLFDEQRKEKEGRISQLNAEITEYNEAREKEMPLVNELDSKIKELRQTVPNLNNHQVSLRGSLRKMKEKAKEMDDKISKAEFDLLQNRQDNANLKAKVVQSPDKLQRVLEEKKAALLEAKNSERMTMQSCQEKSSTVEVYSKALKKMSKQLAQMKTVQEQVNSAKSIEKELKQLKTKLTDDGIQDMSLEAKIVERQGKVDQLGQHKRQLEKERDLRCEENAKELNKVKLEVESRRQNLDTRREKIEAVLAEVDAMRSKANSYKDLGIARQQVLLQKCEEILNEFRQYSQLVNTILLEFDAAGSG
ncbi:hypothetical protein Dimus_018137 [Dionaea muscipula]